MTGNVEKANYGSVKLLLNPYQCVCRNRKINVNLTR